MEKLSPEALNRLIGDCITDNEEEGLLIPRTMTYTEDVYIDFNKLIDNKERFEDLLRQTLPFFSKNTDMPFPLSFFQQIGERNDKGQFKYWTNNLDDLSRLTLLAMYAGVIDSPKKVLMKNSKGDEREVLTHKLLRKLKPAVVRGEAKQPTEPKEIEGK